MKIRQAQTSASYLLPDPGELNKRIVIRRRVDEPTDSFGLAPTFPESFRAYAKMAQVGAATYQASVQTETTVTHYFTLRYRSGITADHEVVLSGQVYRVRRVRDLNSKERFLLLECEELGSETRRSERHGGESVFTR